MPIFTRTYVFQGFVHQNRPQDEAKIAARSPQDGPKTVLKTSFFDVEICFRFWSVWGSILVTFGAPFGSQVGAQIGPKIDQNRPATPDGPKGAQERPKSTPRGTQGRSWGGLGRSWGGLGRPWDGLGSPLPSPSGLVGANPGSPFISFFRF